MRKFNRSVLNKDCILGFVICSIFAHQIGLCDGKIDYGQGFDFEICPPLVLNCSCGNTPENYNKLDIKQCTYFVRWMPHCKPCNDPYMTETVACLLYFNETTCASCAQGKYGQRCHRGCIPPENENNVIWDVPSTQVGDVIRAKCVQNYVLIGSEVMTCLRNGTWSGTPPICANIMRLAKFQPDTSFYAVMRTVIMNPYTSGLA